MSKPVVHFKGQRDFISRFDDGQVGNVYALDHPRLGECWVITSEVLKKFPDGSFETLNSLYVPEKETD